MPVRLLAVDLGRRETILVDVVHSLLALLDTFVQSRTDNRREVEVVFLNLLSLILADGDVLPSHHMRIMRIGIVKT